MRPGFQEIVSGWLLVDDFDHLTDRIERSAEWAVANGPLEDDEAATARMMVERQIAMGIERGDFDFLAPATDCGTCEDCPNADGCQRALRCFLGQL